MRIGLMTVGMPCAGLNTAICAITICANAKYGSQVFGIREGIIGLLQRPVDVEELTENLMHGSINSMSGTIIGTTTVNDVFGFPMPDGTTIDRSDEVIEGYQSLGLEALIAIADEPSMEILKRVAAKGNIPIVGILSSIENQIGVSDVSMGYLTALTVTTDALQELRSLNKSDRSTTVFEVSGRSAGHIALNAGIAALADVVLIPEIPYSLDVVAKKIENLRQYNGRDDALIVVAEGIATETNDDITSQITIGRESLGEGGPGYKIANYLRVQSGIKTRVIAAGDLVRASPPNAPERLAASILGVHAVEIITEGKANRIVGIKGRRVVDISFGEALADFAPVDVDGPLVRTARGLNICFGDTLDC